MSYPNTTPRRTSNLALWSATSLCNRDALRVCHAKSSNVHFPRVSSLLKSFGVANIVCFIPPLIIR